jgi:hypothetical protein
MGSARITARHNLNKEHVELVGGPKKEEIRQLTRCSGRYIHSAVEPKTLSPSSSRPHG